MKDFIEWYDSKLEDTQPPYVYLPMRLLLILTLFLLIVGVIIVVVESYGVPLVLIPLGLYVWYVEDTKQTKGYLK